MELCVSALSKPNENTKSENYCRMFSCATKICKNRHKLANCITIRTYHNGKIVAEASAALRHQNRSAPQNHQALRNSEGEITFRPHHKPGHCAISKWPGPVSALTVPLCQETWGVPENQHQGQHWLSCELKCKPRGKIRKRKCYEREGKTLAKPQNIVGAGTDLH